jgi:hypothetical protein
MQWQVRFFSKYFITFVFAHATKKRVLGPASGPTRFGLQGKGQPACASMRAKIKCNCTKTTPKSNCATNQPKQNISKPTNQASKQTSKQAHKSEASEMQLRNQPTKQNISQPSNQPTNQPSKQASNSEAKNANAQPTNQTEH